MGIPTYVHTAKHNHSIGSNLLGRVPAFRSLPTIPSPPEPRREADRTLKLEKSKLLTPILHGVGGGGGWFDTGIPF